MATLRQMRPQKFFSNEEPTTQDVHIIVALPTPPDNIVKSLQQCMRGNGDGDDVSAELGRGKRRKLANCLYAKNFWRHRESDDEDDN